MTFHPPPRPPQTTTITNTNPTPCPKIFDPWNSSSTGHQRAENRLAGSTSWRESRTAKLGHQFRSGPGGGKRVYDSVGAGSRDFGRDGRKENGAWERGARGLREKGCRDLRGWVGGERKIKNGGGGEEEEEEEEAICRKVPLGGEGPLAPEGEESTSPKEPEQKDRKIFQHLCVYINGSTAPTVSDHKLKFLLADNGAKVSIALGRRSVTHVILGTPNALGGSGGGLAAGKIQKEIKRVGGCGVKYVGVEWVLQSLKAGKRLPEARFSNMSTAHKGQKSVYGMFKKGESMSMSTAEGGGEEEEG